MEIRCGGLLFTSKFDSGNLARVEKVTKDEDEEDSGKIFLLGQIKKIPVFRVTRSYLNGFFRFSGKNIIL